MSIIICTNIGKYVNQRKCNDFFWLQGTLPAPVSVHLMGFSQSEKVQRLLLVKRNTDCFSFSTLDGLHRVAILLNASDLIILL